MKKCNCISESEKNIIDFIKENHAKKPDVKFTTIEKGQYKNKVFGFIEGGGGLEMSMSNQFEITGTKVFKSGKTREVSKVVTVTPPYCCFCGKKLNPED